MAFFLLDWWRRRRQPAWTSLRFTLYTRPGCHLCAEAARVLARARRRYHFELEAIDVDTDPQLAERHGLDVPVVTVNGKLRFRGQVNPVLLERLLRAEAGRGQS